MPRILVTPTHLNNVPGKYKDILQQAGFEVVYPPRGVNTFDPVQLVQQLRGIDGVLASVEPFTRDVIAQSKLRVIARHGVGYDAIDVAAATERNVLVTITPGANEDSVAELAIALILGVYRGFPWRDREVRTGQWTRKALPRLAGKTLGLIGFGRIGKAVAWRAKGLGLQIVACDPCLIPDVAAQHAVTPTTLAELLATSDIVSLHAPVTPETRQLINATTLAQMKRGAVLINTSRGGLVEESALVTALKSGHLFAAGLDVYAQEPLPTTSPLIGLDNVLCSPHMAGIDEESMLAMSTMSAQCLADLYHGRWPTDCVVNAQLQPGWSW